MNITTHHLTGDKFLIENFDELDNIRVRLDLHGAEAVALATVLLKLGQDDLDPICQNIAQSILKRLSQKLGVEPCALSI